MQELRIPKQEQWFYPERQRFIRPFCKPLCKLYISLTAASHQHPPSLIHRKISEGRSPSYLYFSDVILEQLIFHFYSSLYSNKIGLLLCHSHIEVRLWLRLSWGWDWGWFEAKVEMRLIWGWSWNMVEV